MSISSVASSTGQSSRVLNFRCAVRMQLLVCMKYIAYHLSHLWAVVYFGSVLLCILLAYYFIDLY